MGNSSWACSPHTRATQRPTDDGGWTSHGPSPLVARLRSAPSWLAPSFSYRFFRRPAAFHACSEAPSRSGLNPSPCACCSRSQTLPDAPLRRDGGLGQWACKWAYCMQNPRSFIPRGFSFLASTSHSSGGGGGIRTCDQGLMSPCWQVRRRSPPFDFPRRDAENAEARTVAIGGEPRRPWGRWMLRGCSLNDRRRLEGHLRP